MNVFRFMWAISILATLAAGCGSDEFVPAPVPELVFVDAGTGGETDPNEHNTCGPTQLCERTIDECGIQFTQPQCEAWYETPSNCQDFDAYTECNCDCVQEATCDGYFSCGEVCFEDFC